MRAELESIVSGSDEALYSRYFEQPVFDHPFHFHPEIEIVSIVKSEGALLVGDYVGSFSEGDALMFGPNLPHVFSQTLSPASGAVAEVLHFAFEAPGALAGFFRTAECMEFTQLIERARLGIVFDRATAAAVFRLLRKIRQAAGLRRWLHFIELAERLVHAPAKKTLANSGYSNRFSPDGSDRIGKVCQYLLENFREEFSHRDLAQKFNMAPSSFSRSFKNSTRKTYQSFLSEIRLGHACRLLTLADATITEIAYDSGFRNLSNFNRRFKDAYGCSPREYRSRVNKLSKRAG